MIKANWNIDTAQLRALVRTGLRHDLRRSRFLSGTGRKTVHPIRALILVGLFSLMLGVGFAMYAVGARSILLASIISCSSAMFIAASMILVEYYAIILSPDDFNILGHMPMTSQTYFAGKLTLLLIYILGFASISAIPAAVGFMIRSPFSLWRGAVAFSCILFAALTAAMLMVLFYTALSRLLPQRPLKYIISFVQVVASFLIYGGYALMPRLVPESWLTLAWQPTLIHLFIPSAWFGALMQILLGRFAPWNIYAATIGVVIFGNAAYYGLRHLAKNYFMIIAGDRQAAVEAAIEKRGAPSIKRNRLPLLFRRPEERIIATLLSGQFRNDTKFRMAILTIIPLIAMYMFIAIQENALHDPFLDSSISIADSGLIYFAMLLIPLLVKQSIEMSDSHEAAWIFFASPTSLHRLVLAAKRVSYFYFVMPTVVAVSVLFAYFFNHVAHAALHGLTLALLVYFAQQLVFMLKPTVPFSEPRTRGRQGALYAMAFFVGPGAGFAAMILIGKMIYPHPDRLPVFYAIMFIFILTLDRVLAWQMARKFTPGSQPKGAAAFAPASLPSL
jgi:hypothetical protein